MIHTQYYYSTVATHYNSKNDMTNQFYTLHDIEIHCNDDSTFLNDYSLFVKKQFSDVFVKQFAHYTLNTHYNFHTSGNVMILQFTGFHKHFKGVYVTVVYRILEYTHIEYFSDILYNNDLVLLNYLFKDSNINDSDFIIIINNLPNNFSYFKVVSYYLLVECTNGFTYVRCLKGY